MLRTLFEKKGKGLYFALVVADRPTDGFKFESDKDCKMFMVTGEVDRKEVIPTDVLKEIVSRFAQPKPKAKIDTSDQVKISERKL